MRTTHPPVSRKFAEKAIAVEESQLLIARRFIRGGLWPLWELFDNTLEKHRRTIDHFIDPLIEEARKRQRLHGAGTAIDSVEGEEPATLLDELVASVQGYNI